MIWVTKISLEIETDASSGVAIAMRRGLGRVRHLDVRCLWLQHLIAKKVLKISKIPGLENVADVGTKLLDRKTLYKHLHTIGVRRLRHGTLMNINDEVNKRFD